VLDSISYTNGGEACDATCNEARACYIHVGCLANCTNLQLLGCSSMAPFLFANARFSAFQQAWLWPVLYSSLARFAVYIALLATYRTGNDPDRLWIAALELHRHNVATWPLAPAVIRAQRYGAVLRVLAVINGVTFTFGGPGVSSLDPASVTAGFVVGLTTASKICVGQFIVEVLLVGHEVYDAWQCRKDA
jgi:hypothetical protein